MVQARLPNAEPDLLVLGEVMRVLVAEPGEALARADHFRSTIGGAEGNVAIGAARLGLHAGWVGKVGADDAGAYVLRRMRAEGVGVDQVGVDANGFTGLLIRNTSAHGAISVSYHRAGSAGSTVEPELVQRAWTAGTPRMVHVSGITAMLSASSLAAVKEFVASATRSGVPVSFDVNLRLRLAPIDRWRSVLPPIAAAADILFAGDAELALLADRPDEQPTSTVQRLIDNGVTAVVLKNSDHSCTVVTADGTATQRPLARQVVDPVGAGDALVAGYLSGQLSGATPAESLRRGAAAAALAVQAWSDTDGLPTAAELEHFLAATDTGREQVLR